MRLLSVLYQGAPDGNLAATFRYSGLRSIPPELAIHIELCMPPGNMPDRKKLAAYASVSAVPTN